MLASDSSDDSISTSLLGKRAASPPMSMRSTKSAISQVKDTLFSFIKRPKVDSSKSKGDGSDVSVTVSEKQRTLDAFTERVKSFTVTNWMGKPLCLSPPLLAQYGWQCIGIDTVKCCSCSAVLCVRLPWPSAENYRRQCYKFRQKVITSHMKICSWPSYPCSDSFVSPLLHGAQGMPEICSDFTQRRANLLLLKNKLPKIDQNVIIEMNLQRKDLGAILKAAQSKSSSDEIFEIPDDTTEFSPSEICSILALCGWDTIDTASSKLQSLFCASSGKVVRLHNFFAVGDTLQPSDESNDESDSSQKLLQSVASPKVSKTSSNENSSSVSPLKIEKQFFHPLKQHSPWSHWVSTLKPISKDEFDDGDDALENEDLFQYVVNPLVKDSLRSWRIVVNLLLGRKGMGEKVVPPENDRTLRSKDHSSDEIQLERSQPGDGQKSPPRFVVAHVRKLLKEWSSPK